VGRLFASGRFRIAAERGGYYGENGQMTLKNFTFIFLIYYEFSK
jgi:hypothetical protein